MKSNYQPRIRMFAGPNGSGKTTLKSVVPSELLKALTFLTILAAKNFGLPKRKIGKIIEIKSGIIPAELRKYIIDKI